MSEQELWQWIHYSYGEDLGLTSDDDDYVTLSTEDKVQFQQQLQMEERMVRQSSDVNLASDNAANKVGHNLTEHASNVL